MPSASITSCRSPQTEIPVSAGSPIPDVDITLESGDVLNLRDYFSRKNGVIFAVPG